MFVRLSLKIPEKKLHKLDKVALDLEFLILICLFTGSLLESQNMGGGPASFPGSSFGELSSSKMTVLENLSERRDSTSSTLSSVYTLSRRSSGISPCFSSRRSSQASQFGANRPSNISSADSYDPISADISRRSSQASQCGGSGGGAGVFGAVGLPSPLSLTPAQHYRLKAKYAAATGGVPPTPLPYMDQMCLKSHAALYEDSQKPSTNKGLPFRQYSSYATRSLMPHEVPSNIPRRASDPVRQVAPETLNQSQLHRYNSMGTLSGRVTIQPCPPATADHRRLSQQDCHRSDGGLHRYPYSLRPPSISENATMETTTSHIPDNGDKTNEDFQGASAIQQQHFSQRRMAIVNLLSQILPTSRNSPGQQQQMCPPSPSNVPASSGLMDASQEYSRLQVRGNLAVLQQNHNFGSLSNHFSSNQQLNQNLTMQQRYIQLNSEPGANCLQQQGFQQPLNLNEALLNEGIQPYDRNGNTTYKPCINTISGSNCKQESCDMETFDLHFADAGFQPVQIKIEHTDTSICNMNSPNPSQVGNQNNFQPRPPTEPRSLNKNPSVPKVTQQMMQAANANSELSTAGVLGLHRSNNANDNALYYTGQIQVYEPNGNVNCNKVVPPTSSANQTARTSDCTTALEQAQIDFDSMLDDGDHSSLMSGTLSPGLLQSLSQSSSRLTTPRNSVTLPSVPAGTGNMAIGDMSSLLTALAEESKFLNLMS